MRQLLDNMGRAFLKMFAATLIVVLPGIASQPTLHAAIALGIAALAASIVAGITAVQSYVPQLTFERFLGPVYGPLVDTFARAFLAFFLTAVTGLLQEPMLSGWRSALAAAVTGAIAAGLRALQGLLTPGEHPNPAAGLSPPTPPSQGRTTA